MRGTCDACRNQRSCAECGKPVAYFDHVGVRASSGSRLGSGIWHVASPCGHAQKPRVKTAAGPGLAVYNGGPLWQSAFRWQNVYWGTYWHGKAPAISPAEVDLAVNDIEANRSYSGGLSEYNVRQGAALPSKAIADDPPSTMDDSQVGPKIKAWIQSGLVPDLGQQGAYNIFLPPGTSVTLGGSASCQSFCDYHNFDGNHFYTVEPYPCTAGCNQCTPSAFDTLTMGLSEEMTELKTDMNPGTGWVIGNEELCDYCDASFVCRKVSTGEYVNAWYSNARRACWAP
ncbi:MAG: hypothetical protein JRM80_03895 [Nitrososphaerota archaeon]|nr:hypothetical protein [Nitrososphaerota archaeon]